ncbi:CHAT domain-containing protein [Rhizobium leguminosarum]|nr:CHAT domain-containing protein [Rhizobium ruizarguesonis]NEK31554.1 CHAT domain-containing protein [Rhizobium ruizarguesonis]
MANRMGAEGGLYAQRWFFCVRSVVATLWSVVDQSTATFMVRFYFLSACRAAKPYGVPKSTSSTTAKTRPSR